MHVSMHNYFLNYYHFVDEEGEHYSQEFNHGTKHTHVLHYYGDGAERK